VVLTPRYTGALLVVAFAVFLVGAGFWRARRFDRPLTEMLHAVHAWRSRWLWIHRWMFAGTLLSMMAVTALVMLLLEDGGGLLAAAGLGVFVFGCLAFLVALVARLTSTPRAAEELLHTNTVSIAYQSRIVRAKALHFVHMYLSYAAFILLGGAILAGSTLPGWLGWTGVAAGVVGPVGFTLIRGGPLAAPIIAHSYGLVVGMVLLLK